MPTTLSLGAPTIGSGAVPRPKSIALAYCLWFAFAAFGAHRLYTGQRTSGLVMLGLTLTSLATVPFGIGLIGAVLVMVWIVGDGFLIPGMVRDAAAAAVS